MKKTVAIILSCCLMICVLAAMLPVSAADDSQVRTVIGANLTNEQTESVYATFGITRGSVKELSMTNAEERTYLEGVADESVIGTNSISCVYMELLEAGAGTSVTASNVTWCTEDMYRSALATAGVTDVKIIVTAPFQVSGTAALAGIYKAYEDITGKALDETAKQVGTQELVTTADLANELGKYDAAQIVTELKSILSETKNMTDDELRAKIVEIAGQYSVTLTDGQLTQLITLCRQMEGLSDSELTDKVEDLKNTVQKLGEIGEKAEQAKDTVTGVAQTVRNIFAQVSAFFTNLFGGK